MTPIVDATDDDADQSRAVMCDLILAACSAFGDSRDVTEASALALLAQSAFKVLCDNCGPASRTYFQCLIDVSHPVTPPTPREFAKIDRRMRDAFDKMAAYSDRILAGAGRMQ